MPRLTDHQKRVLAALLALEEKHGCRWWTRDQIGDVVAAGGFHQVIQVSTISRLKQHGLVQTEWRSWPEETQRLVRVNCAGHYWGLTGYGEEVARGLAIRWPAKAIKRVERMWCTTSDPHRDEDDLRRYGGGGDDDDDDDDGSPAPAPPQPTGVCV